MTKEHIKRVRQIYGWALSIVIVIAGICLMVQCFSIYRSGDQPFSREAVAAHFSPIAVPVFLCLAMVIGGFVLELFLPKDPRKPAVQKQHRMILERLREKKDLSGCDEALRGAIEAQRKSRSRHQLILGILCVVCGVVFLCYGANPDNFHQSDINTSMIRAMYVLVPCLCIPFGYAVFTAHHNSVSIRKEIELMKQAPSAAAEQPAKKKDRLAAVRWAVAAAAIALLVYGFVSGGTADVLTKAVNICTECVGLG